MSRLTEYDERTGVSYADGDAPTPPPPDPLVALIQQQIGGGGGDVGPPRGTVLNSRATRNSDGSVTTVYTRADGAGGTYETTEISAAPFQQPPIVLPQNPPASSTSPVSFAGIQSVLAANPGATVDDYSGPNHDAGPIIVHLPNGSSVVYDPARNTPLPDGSIGFNPTYHAPAAASTSSASNRTIGLTGAAGRVAQVPSSNAIGAVGRDTATGNVRAGDLSTAILQNAGAIPSTGTSPIVGGGTSTGAPYTAEELASDLARHNASQFAQQLAAFRIKTTGNPLQDAANLNAVMNGDRPDVPSVASLMSAGLTQGQAISQLQSMVMNKPPVDEDGHPQSNEVQTIAYGPPGIDYYSGATAISRPSSGSDRAALFARGGGLRLREPVVGYGMFSRRPLFYAAEAGRQENVRPFRGGLRFTPTPQPIKSPVYTPQPIGFTPGEGGPTRADIRPLPDQFQRPTKGGLQTGGTSGGEYRPLAYADGGDFSFSNPEGVNISEAMGGGSIPSSSTYDPGTGTTTYPIGVGPTPTPSGNAVTGDAQAQQAQIDAYQNALNQAAAQRAASVYDYRYNMAGLPSPVTMTLPTTIESAYNGTRTLADVLNIPAGVRPFYVDPTLLRGTNTTAATPTGGLSMGGGVLPTADMAEQANRLGISLAEYLARLMSGNVAGPQGRVSRFTGAGAAGVPVMVE